MVEINSVRIITFTVIEREKTALDTFDARIISAVLTYPLKIASTENGKLGLVCITITTAFGRNEYKLWVQSGRRRARKLS